MPPPLSSIIRATVTSIRTHGVHGAWQQAKENNLGAGLWDGGLLVMKLKSADGTTFKGVDRFGNKYWEKIEDTLHGRHRWVEYASPWDYEAANVPPEWHGWLHHITDHTADQLEELKSKRLELAIKDEAKYMPKVMCCIHVDVAGSITRHGNLEEMIKFQSAWPPLLRLSNILSRKRNCLLKISVKTSKVQILFSSMRIATED